MFNFSAIFKVVKIDFGSKFWAWVYFHATILKALKFQEIWGRAWYSPCKLINRLSTVLLEIRGFFSKRKVCERRKGRAVTDGGDASIVTDKQQELDLPSLRVEEAGDARPSKKKDVSPRPVAGTMSHIQGVKRALCHTNSFTGERVPLHGVETPYEDELGQMIADIDRWGIDIFRIAELSNNRPLTAVAFAAFQVTQQALLNISLHLT